LGLLGCKCTLGNKPYKGGSHDKTKTNVLKIINKNNFTQTIMFESTINTKHLQQDLDKLVISEENRKWVFIRVNVTSYPVCHSK